MKFSPTLVSIVRSGRRLATTRVCLDGVTISEGARPQDKAFATNVQKHLEEVYGLVPMVANNITRFVAPSFTQAAA